MAEFDARTGMTILDESTCWDLFAGSAVARLAVAVGRALEIFPINTVVDNRTIVFSTGEGTKLAAATIARNVVLEVDGHDETTGEAWSVVVKGEAERLDRFEDIERAESLALHPWTAHPKQWFVRVRPHEITGRRFTVATS